MQDEPSHVTQVSLRIPKDLYQGMGEYVEREKMHLGKSDLLRDALFKIFSGDQGTNLHGGKFVRLGTRVNAGSVSSSCMGEHHRRDYYTTDYAGPFRFTYRQTREPLELPDLPRGESARLNVRVPSGIWNAVKTKAKRLKTTPSDLVVYYMDDFLRFYRDNRSPDSLET